MDAEVQAAVQQWLQLDVDPRTRREVQRMHEARDEAGLREALLGPRISFGTAGLRAAMGPGLPHMNLLTVTQATQGLFSHMEASFADLRERGVVVGYDGRHNSYDFAMRTAAIFLSKVCWLPRCFPLKRARQRQGVKVYLFSEVVPTPFVSFGVIHLKASKWCAVVLLKRFVKACGGVMVTASHNPAADNGYKARSLLFIVCCSSVLVRCTGATGLRFWRRTTSTLRR